jgi:flagellar basal-body rod modification protein FlgD
MQTVPVEATSAVTQARAERGMSALTSEDFFQILVSELQHQDPFEPAKTGDMIGQVSQIRSIELSKNLTDALSQLTRQQRTAGASELLGKFVTANVQAADGSQQEVSGVVTGVRFDSDGSLVLELDTGQSVLASDVTRITSVQTAEQPATGAQSSASGQAGTGQQAASSAASADKSSQQAKERSGGLLPWLSLDASIHL